MEVEIPKNTCPVDAICSSNGIVLKAVDCIVEEEDIVATIDDIISNSKDFFKDTIGQYEINR